MFKNKLVIVSAIGALFISSCSNEMSDGAISEDNSENDCLIEVIFANM